MIFFSGEIRFAMSLPAIVAQLINLLYNLVDRVYIGHMPEDGALALRVGVCLPIIMIVSAFAALVSNGGAPRGFHGDGERATMTRRKKILATALHCRLSSPPCSRFCCYCFTDRCC